MRNKSELRGSQQDIVTALYESDEKICVLRPGGGKTISALTAIDELIHHGVIRHALIMAPKRVARAVWPDEIAEWSHTRHLRYAVLSESPSERAARLKSAPGRDLTIFGHDIVSWLLDQIKDLPDDHPLFDLLVIDEISRFRVQTGERYKKLKDYVHRWRMIWGLSGTLRPTSQLDLFCPARLVSRGKLWGRSFYKWQLEHFYATDREGYHWAALPGHEDVLNAEIAPLVVTGDLPKMDEPSIIFDRVELPADARLEYNKMERKLFAVVGTDETGEDKKVVAGSSAIAVGKLGQMANGFVYDGDLVHYLHEVKFEWLKDLIENATDPTLLIYEYQEDFEMIRRVLGPDFPYLGAGISGAKSDANIKAWNAGKLPFMALHPASGGHGLNLQHGGADMAWIAPTWNSELWDQTLARLHRSGQKRQVVVRVCVANDTIDDAKIDRVYHKLSAQEAFERYLHRVAQRSTRQSAAKPATRGDSAGTEWEPPSQSHSDTSVGSAGRVSRRRVREQERWVYETLRRYYPKGLADWELWALVQIERPGLFDQLSSVHRARVGLKWRSRKQGATVWHPVGDSDQKTVNPESGEPQTVRLFKERYLRVPYDEWVEKFRALARGKPLRLVRSKKA